MTVISAALRTWASAWASSCTASSRRRYLPQMSNSHAESKPASLFTLLKGCACSCRAPKPAARVPSPCRCCLCQHRFQHLPRRLASMLQAQRFAACELPERASARSQDRGCKRWPDRRDGSTRDPEVSATSGWFRIAGRFPAKRCRARRIRKATAARPLEADSPGRRSIRKCRRALQASKNRR